ncbi:MAG: hypothetical protein E7623_01630 [Ruminococcaceae bacterium]|nr:hypothetical protein [Oscillospiraceae bacterium]
MSSEKIMSLHGEWTIIKDENKEGKDKGWYKSIPDVPRRSITVPGYMKLEKWGLDYTYSTLFSQYHGYVWYYKELDAVPDTEEGERLRIEFDRAGYVCEVWINGHYLGEHRHHEEQFSYDITEYIVHDGKNLIAVRCFEPVRGKEAIDGIQLDKIPNGVWANVNLPGWDPNVGTPPECIGGLTGEVRLSVVPEIRIADIHVIARYDSGETEVRLVLTNDSGTEKETEINVNFSEQKFGNLAAKVSDKVKLVPGENFVILKALIPNHKNWELNSPVLYIADVKLDNGASKTVRFGFKELRVKDGFLFLNGKRMLLKSAHALPNGQNVIQMKSLGFNAIRSIHRIFDTEVMDICDEIGLLVIESPPTSWGMRMHEKTREMVEAYTLNMIKLHRNHPSLGAYYAFNELAQSDIMHCAADSLKPFRDADPNNLILISSGRWDLENMMASASNPGSYEWDGYFGAEGIEDFCEKSRNRSRHLFGHFADCALGDLHTYMHMPMSEDTKDWFRTVGYNSRPVMITESGVGAQEDPMRWCLNLESLGFGDDYEPYRCIKGIWDKLENFIDFYGLKGIYPFANDLCRESNRLNGRQREHIFDIIRSNPMISGYSLTSMGDDCEGLLEGEYVMKENVSYAMQCGLAPLKWSLFTSDRTVYANVPFEIEAVLCNEDRLAPGIYKASARIKGKDGIVWQKDFDAVYPENGYAGLPPLAATVLKEKVSLPAGEYIFAVRLLEKAAPFGGELKVKVLEPTLADKVEEKISVLGLCEGSKTVLTRYAISYSEFENYSGEKLILVGNTDIINDDKIWADLRGAAEDGANVVFLSSYAFEKAPDRLKEIVGEKAGTGDRHCGLYHVDNVHIDHPLFYNIEGEGMADFETYGAAYPKAIFTNVNKPDLSISAAIQIGREGADHGLSLGEYNIGKGRFVLSGYKIADVAGKHPISDQLLLNFVSNYTK